MPAASQLRWKRSASSRGGADIQREHGVGERDSVGEGVQRGAVDHRDGDDAKLYTSDGSSWPRNRLHGLGVWCARPCVVASRSGRLRLGRRGKTASRSRVERHGAGAVSALTAPRQNP